MRIMPCAHAKSRKYPKPHSNQIHFWYLPNPNLSSSLSKGDCQHVNSLPKDGQPYSLIRAAFCSKYVSSWPTVPCKASCKMPPLDGCSVFSDMALSDESPSCTLETLPLGVFLGKVGIWETGVSISENKKGAKIVCQLQSLCLRHG